MKEYKFWEYCIRNLIFDAFNNKRNKAFFFIALHSVFYNQLSAQTNWELLNPKPTANSGSNIEFVSKDIGFIMTSTELLQTFDSGNTWTKKQNILAGTDMSIREGIGFIVGNNGYVLKSTNYGKDWYQMSTGSNASFNTVNIIDKNTVILSSWNSIIKTTDGGLSWSFHSIPNVIVVKTAFTSNLIGHAICYNGVILKTIDGGLSWYNTYTSYTIPSNFFTVYFINQNVGFATREHAHLLKTTDGGETWTDIPMSSVVAIYDIHFINESDGFATGNYGGTYKTNDGGNTWIPIFFQTGLVYNSSMFAIYFQDNNVGFAVGSRGRIVKTTDGGVTWTNYSFTYNDFRQLQFVDDNIGYLQSGDRFYKTTNMGETWTQIGSLNLSEPVLSSVFTFVSENLGYATTGSTYGGHVYKTVDGGLSWSILNNGQEIIDEGITAICFLNDTTGFISGGFNRRTVLKTTNGGNSWTQVSSQIFGKIQFINPLVGYANRIGNYYGAMYKTVDGGNTWNLSIELAGKYINSFHFLDENNGFFVGDSYLCYKTNDGGTTWQPVSVPYGYYKLTKFYSPNIGYIVDENGVIYKTTNAGISWTQIASQPSINSIEFTNNYIFTAGTYGKIYRKLEFCNNSLSFSSPNDNFSNITTIKRAGVLISASNEITNSNITYLAGKYIELNAGFKVLNGSVFKAEIVGCN